MRPHYNDLSPTERTAAIEESLREFWANWGSAPQSELLDHPQMLRLYTGVPYAFCNGVVCSRLSPDELDETIADTVAYFRARHAAWEWIVGPQPVPAGLETDLAKHSLSAPGGSTGMALDLHELQVAPAALDDFSIIPVRNDGTLAAWAEAVVQGFAAPALRPSFLELECSLGAHSQAYRRYLGTLHGQPVATCALMLGASVAGIYCVSTLPQARGLGIGAAITRHALFEAKEQGYGVAVLQSTSMGRGVYRRLGFQELSHLKGYLPTG